MNNNIQNFVLTEVQQALYDVLGPEQQREIDNHILSINNTIPITLQNIQDDWIRLYSNRNLNIPNELNADVVERAKTELRNENIADIETILGGNRPLLRRERGQARESLLNKVVLLMQAVGGKLRKTSNKKAFIRRRRSSKARKARKSRKARTTRRR